jgi:hypothetical protein
MYAMVVWVSTKDTSNDPVKKDPHTKIVDHQPIPGRQRRRRNPKPDFHVEFSLLKKEPRHSVGANPGSYTMIPVAGQYRQRAVLGTGWTIAMMTVSVKLR